MPYASPFEGASDTAAWVLWPPSTPFHTMCRVNALPFGATGSVSGFLRVSTALFHIITFGRRLHNGLLTSLGVVLDTRYYYTSWWSSTYECFGRFTLFSPCVSPFPLTLAAGWWFVFCFVCVVFACLVVLFLSCFPFLQVTG